MNKLLLNKKYVLIPVALVLVATMLMAPMANATKGAFDVINSDKVIMDKSMEDGPDNALAIFNEYDSKALFKSRVGPLPAGAVIYIVGCKNGASQATALYGSNTGNTWTLIGWVTLTSTIAAVPFSGNIGGYEYIAISNQACTICADVVYSQY
ncbi:MAG: hypothetical protein LBH62_01195 [Nitrososphaerota archaeon]|jgi:hypothetical protein|nr:hypothetical protein [Nitrososphaerota archaeon]